MAKVLIFARIAKMVNSPTWIANIPQPGMGIPDTS
jgi:hypothetical protein